MRLLQTKDPVELKRIVAEMHLEARALTEQVYEICWYMRSIGREEAFNLPYEERKMISKLIDANIKRVNETHLPIL